MRRRRRRRAASPAAFSFPEQHAVPWPLNPLVRNFVVKLPRVRAVARKAPAALVPTLEGIEAPLWVVSLWQGHGGAMRASENVEADATVGGNVMFANVNSTTDVLRVQLRDSASSRVVLQGAVRISRPVTSSPASRDGGNHWHRGPCTSSACHIQLGSSRDTDCSVSLSLNVTSFWHRWGYGSERAVVSAARGMTLAWVSRRSDHAGGVGGQHPPPGRQAAVESSSSNLLDEAGVQRLLRTAAENPDPAMVLDLVHRLLAHSSLDSLQRNVEMITSALAAVWRRSRSHEPGVAVVVQITDAVVSMVMKLLGSRAQVSIAAKTS